MAVKSNQEIERYYFELFRRIYPLPKGEVKYGDQPDVIIEGERKLGIEVTNLFLEKGELPESEQKQRPLRKIVLRKAQQKYVNNGGKYEVSFSFNKTYPILDVKNLSSRIANKVLELEKSSIIEGASGYYLNDIQELDFVYINPNLYTDPEWRLTQLYEGQIMSISRLNDIVREKENKTKNYKRCDAYWLLIVIDFADLAQDQEIQSDGVKLKSDIFEKIILYKTIFNQLLEF